MDSTNNPAMNCLTNKLTTLGSPPENKKLYSITKPSDKKNKPVEKPDIVGFRTDNRDMQTRFHFRMDLCVGCHACEVACGEQNGLPVDTQWRRVGEIQTGTFPDTKSYFLSSGCNHCLDAACMKGCPVDAYQVNHRGIVEHLDDTCIGCGYCTWNCPYSVPVLQTDRKIVTKCDMCTHRLDAGLDPACVQACPAGAIQIEHVPLQEIIDTYQTDGVGPDMPSPDITMPSTKITLPKDMKPEDFEKVDRGFVKPEEPHTPLIIMTILTQLGFGGFCAIFLVDLFRTHINPSLYMGDILGWLSPTLMVIIGGSLNASTLHLGRPIFAFRAIKNWRTSWLSREIIGLTLFAKAGLAYSAFLLLTEGLDMITLEASQGNLIRISLGAFTIISGIIGIYCSSKLYRVPARPAWDSVRTSVDFFVTGLILGPISFIFSLAVAMYFTKDSPAHLMTIAQVTAWFSAISLLFMVIEKTYYINKWKESDIHELSACADLNLKYFFRARSLKNVLAGLTLVSLIFLFPMGENIDKSYLLIASGITLLFALTFCTLNRYLFFVTVVPRNIPGNFITSAHDALNHHKK